MSRADHAAEDPAVVRWMKAAESATGLDPAVNRFSRLVAPILARRGLTRVLQGRPIGHALHPVLTDLPLGLWTSATVLDLVGGEQARPAARRLIGLGLLAAGPTIVTGLTEWASADRASQRVGVLHAASNSTAGLLYTASWLARRSGRHGRGTLLALAAGTAAGVGGYLGGHLTEVRKVSTRHEAFDRP